MVTRTKPTRLALAALAIMGCGSDPSGALFSDASAGQGGAPHPGAVDASLAGAGGAAGAGGSPDGGAAGGGERGGSSGAVTEAGAGSAGASAVDSSVRATRDAGSQDATISCAVPTTGDAGSATPLLVNGDFAMGTSSWSSFGASVLTAVTSPARTGSALAITGRTDAWNGASQSILGRATAGQVVQLSAWVRVGAGTAPVDFTLKATVGGQDAYAQVAAGVANATGWTQLTGSLTLNWASEPSSAMIYVEGPAPGVDVYVDDVVATVRSLEEGGTGNADGTVSVLARIDDKHQVLQGFGGSLAWYQDDLVKHPKASEIYPLIFGDLGLDILRLRNRYHRATEVVDLSSEATIVAQATASLGHAPKILMTSWSPPAALKASGKEDCNGDQATCTLVKVGSQFAYTAFAGYWSDALDAYASKSIVPDFISIQNETDFVPNGWEGCQFAPQESAGLPGYDKALLAVSDKLAGRAQRPKLLGPETLGVHWDRVQKYAAALDPKLIDGWAHHLYEKGSGAVWLWQDPGPDSFLAPMIGAAQVETGKPIFMTEFQTDQDTLTSGGFETGWLMHDSLADGNASAWLYWDLAWKDSGMVALGATDYQVRDQYYAVRHYAKFTDPGDVRVGATSNLPAVRVTAWLAPNQSRLTLVLLNVGNADKTVQLSACGYAFTSSNVVRTVFRSDGSSKRWESLGALPASASVVLPSRSMATVVLTR